MALQFTDLFCERTVPCRCMPVRMGASILTLLGIVFGAILSGVVWSEIGRTPDMTSAERAAFVLAGLTGVSFFLVSIFGFVGAVVSKQSFVQLYTYFTSGHFCLNIAASTYLLYMVVHFSTTATERVCQDITQPPEAKERCIVSLTIAKWMYFVITVMVLLIEFCGALVVGYYAKQLKHEKRMERRSRMVNQEAMRLIFPEKNSQYSVLSGDQIAASLGLRFPRYFQQIYDPYEEITRSRYEVPVVGHKTPAFPLEDGYGGGLWTHEEISADEKARLKVRDGEMELPELEREIPHPPTSPRQMVDLLVYDPPRS